MTPTLKIRSCRECGNHNLPLGRSGRCEPCGLKRMILTGRMNHRLAQMSNKELERLLK